MVVGIRLFSIMSSAAWITALSCSCSITESSEHSSGLWIAGQWMRFIFLSPCPQRLLVSLVDLLFLLTILLFALQKLYSRLSSKRNSDSSAREPLLVKDHHPISFRVSIAFKISIFLTSLLAAGYTVLSIFSFTHSTDESSWKLVEAIFRISQTVTQLVIVILLVHEWKFRAIEHPLTLRIYWIANFVITSLLAASAISRLVAIRDCSLDFNLRVDDIFALAYLPISIFFAVVSLRRSCGISAVTDSATSVNSGSYLLVTDTNVSDYASASFLSKTVWIWMNPLLNKGYKSALKIEEVPTLPPEFRSEQMSALFERNWPKPEENCKHPVLITLFRCFWKDVAFTGILALVRLAVMYVGPLLIQVFVSYTASETRSISEGCVLVLILLLAKTTEVLSNHHFQFHSQKLGMQIRASLVTSLYKKGLKLSCSSRQTYGVGQIVNHMAVDAQQMADMMLQLHPIWMMPVQVGVALALIYGYLNVSMFAALLGLVAVVAFVILRTKTNNMYQFLVMKSRDLRMKATNELLNNVRVIKFLAWEEHFGKKIRSFRESEYGWLGKFMYSMSFNFALLGMSPLLIVSLTFAAAIWLGIPLNVGTAFTVTTITKVLQEPVRAFPQSLISISQAMVALGRLDGFMTSKELDERSVEREENCDEDQTVQIKDGSFSWDDEGGDFVLKVPNLEIKKGGLAAVVGTVGSGKSSLLASILGEMHKLSGKVRICGTLAYVAQTSWIQNATIQDNILFGSPMNSQTYKEVIRVCCLEKDLEMMEYGDQTEIGERGINLSGGQKQRIQLARAVYQNCDIYLLDDIFSAVDAQTGSEIFKECVRGALKDKTAVLVTHQVDFLHNADLIVVMRDGMIVQSGKYDELHESGTDFGALVAAHEASMEIVDMGDMSNDDASMLPSSTLPSSIQGEADGEKKSQEKSKSDKKGASKLIEEEEREAGHVRWEVYKQYCTEAYGWWGVVLITFFSLLWPLSLMAGDYWLAYETKDSYIQNPSLFITVYLILAAVACLLVFIRQFIVAYWGLVTAQSFFNGILGSIIRAPMSFFDTTPSGRILSRASTDQFNIDLLVPMQMSMLAVMYLTVVAVIFVTCQYVWPIIFLVLPLCWLNFWYRGYYLASSRELSRLDAITKAPVIHHFSETISGVMTIRGFKKQNSFIQENIYKVNANLRMDFHNNGANEWLGFRLEMFGISVLCVSTLLMIVMPRTMIKPENVGLSLSYGLALNGIISMTIYMSCAIENKMVSVERIKQFTNIPFEAPWKNPTNVPPKNWPSLGDIVLSDLQVRYRYNTPLVLKGISLAIRGGEKIGVVGRTGSGKSTLIQVFFRLIEPSAGQIIIDGIEISKLGLHDLRSRFGIIPQDPVLFEGTVRSNIDPLGLYSDEEIWKSLERCQLKDAVASKSEKLDASVVDGGDNWSVGQRQLLCLGRVMLKRCKILFMDEATASVDSQTDAAIQKIIREDFAACTIISIAHRIPTVMDCDRVLVIDEGWAKDFDKPSRLLERPSIFGALVQEYTNRSSETS